jgi:hypothetical protein
MPTDPQSPQFWWAGDSSLYIQADPRTPHFFCYSIGQPAELPEHAIELTPARNNWYDDRANLALLVEHMLAEGSDHSEVVRAIEKPWGYEDEFNAARA